MQFLINFNQLFYLPIITGFILIYYNEFIEVNYVPFTQRFLNLFKMSTVYRLIRFSFFINLILLFIYYSDATIEYSKSLKSYNSRFYKSLEFYWLNYSILIIIIITIIYFIQRKKIVLTFKNPQESKLNKLYSKYVLYKISSFIFTILVYVFIYKLYEYIDHFLLS
jgi:hypothetical protein